MSRFKLYPAVTGWFKTLILIASWTYISIVNYQTGDLMKYITWGLILVFMGHIIIGICKGLSWLLCTFILMDMKTKLEKES